MRKRFSILATILALSLSALAADTYTIDPNHSAANFAVKHLALSTVHGRFTDVSGTVTFDPNDVSKSSVKATIKSASITTDNATRDKHLNSADFFDTAKFPEITFQSTSVRKVGEGQYVAVGNLTIKDVTKQVEVPFTLSEGKNMRGVPELGVEAHLALDRTDYHVSYDPNGMAVSKNVNIELDVEAIQNK
ncbi:MAG TPA: YceI family protein [candidate division Zixibacteria bacterium]|nr:YceI family protein [candidate division Zixibacteria bacterium]